jgi:hypothetical protein
MGTVHELKTWNPSFSDILSGVKTFEVRKGDRDYKVGDALLLREYEPVAGIYTGRDCRVYVTYVLALDPWCPGYVGMSITTSLSELWTA